VNACGALVGKPREKRPLESPRSRWEDGIKMDGRGIGRGVMDWIHLDKDRDQWRALVNMEMNLQVPYDGISKLLLLK
jgi:hypothetical protein